MSQFKSLLGLNELAVDSLNILNLDLTNTNIIGLNTDRVPEDADPVNLYFTNARFDTRLALKSTTDIKEGINLYYTDNRFDARIGTKSIDVLSDVAITTAADNQLLIYSTGQWRNTNLPFLRLDGTATMSGGLNIGGQSITNVNLVDGIDVSVLDASVVKLTGNQSIAGTKTFTDKITTSAGKPIIIGRSAKGVNGPTGGLELYGNYADNIGGAHIQAITSEDDYPTFSLINTSHGSIFMGFDAYIDNFNWKSSYSTSNFAIAKVGDYLRIFYDSNRPVGSDVPWENVAITIDTTGLLYTKAITASGLIMANAGIDMKSQNITNVNLLNTISVSSIITTANFNSTFDTQLATKSTTNLAEGTNLYYTSARANTDFDTRLATKSTTNLAEGTNLYYTSAKANTDFDTRLGNKSIDALSDVVITTATDNQLLIYSTGQWRNVASPFLRLDGTASMTAGLNMGGFSITNVNLVDGVDVSVLDTSAVKLTGDQTIAGNKTFSDKITTSSGKPIIIGNTRKGIGTTGGLELYGTFNNNTTGAHIQAITTEDIYPTFQLTNIAHNNINMTFDAYLDAGGWKSGYASSNFLISKWNNKLRFLYDSGKAVGTTVPWSLALELDTAGLLTTKAITASGAITANAGVSTTTLTASGLLTANEGCKLSIQNKVDGGEWTVHIYVGY